MKLNGEESAHKVVETSLQTKEEVRVCRLRDISNRAVGQNQVKADNGVDSGAVLVGLVGVPCDDPLVCRYARRRKTNLRQARGHLRQPVTRQG